MLPYGNWDVFSYWSGVLAPAPHPTQFSPKALVSSSARFKVVECILYYIILYYIILYYIILYYIILYYIIKQHAKEHSDWLKTVFMETSKGPRMNE